MTSGDLLWAPAADALDRTRLGDFIRFVERTRGVRVIDQDSTYGPQGGPADRIQGDEYGRLWEWSVLDVAGFWAAVWDYFEIIAHTEPTSVLADPTMPGARWFEGATVNYAEHVLRMPGLADDDPVVLAYSQSRPASAR